MKRFERVCSKGVAVGATEQTSVLITKECIDMAGRRSREAAVRALRVLVTSTAPHEDGAVLTFFNSDVAAGFFTGFHMAHRGQRVYYRARRRARPVDHEAFGCRRQGLEYGARLAMEVV